MKSSHMNNRIEEITDQARATGKKLLIPYLVAGDPDLDTTLLLMHSLVEQGADVIELGIPFSDPSSDGPVIQRGVERSLTKKTTLLSVLELVATFRSQDHSTGVVLMGYLNPIEILGYSLFAVKAAEAGVDGVLVVDLPPSEAGELNGFLRAKSIATIYLVAPTTTLARAEAITEQCRGYLYYVSLKGVTGAEISDFSSVEENVQNLRKLTDLPIVIGFGIKDADSAVSMASLADGVIIGSALVEQIALLENSSDRASATIKQTTELIGTVRTAIDNIK